MRVLQFLLAGALLAGAAAGAGLAAGAGSGPQREQRGEAKLVIGKGENGQELRLLPGHAVSAGTLQVMGKGMPLSLAKGEQPKTGEYALLPGNVLRFSPDDVRREVTVTYLYVPRRVATLPAVNQSDIDYMAPAAQTALAEVLGKLGFVLVPEAEVKAAVRLQKITFDAVTSGVGEPPDAQKVAELTKALGADYLLVPVVNAGEGRGDAVIFRSGIVAADVYAQTRLALLMYDGESGELLLSRVKSGSRDSSWTGNRRARKRMLRDMVSEILGGYFGIRP